MPTDQTEKPKEPERFDSQDKKRIFNQFLGFLKKRPKDKKIPDLSKDNDSETEDIEDMPLD